MQQKLVLVFDSMFKLEYTYNACLNLFKSITVEQ